MKRLFRSRTDKQIAGICGGLAEYLGMESGTVRILWVVSAFVFGFGLVLYFAAWIIVPPGSYVSGIKPSPEQVRNRNRGVGTAIFIAGLLMLLGHLDIIRNNWISFHIFPWRLLWPLCLIGFGIYLLFSGGTFSDIVAKLRQRAAQVKMVKRPEQRMVFGVCAGIGNYYHTDPTLIRLIMVAAALLGEEMIILFYIALAVIMPYEKQASTPADA